eukprot:CAMPEP_0197516034 /NCGR_PEP_ID=MMETSP1318-20131121/951_1 /TAXON_ID=552666 /ORGANISM="Partenskyella glossopodia, Strain RCC365" /LENGTH=73 /DNA_ID=CAMNT_0043064539 /DNA_START=52 /DNA_END=273 /DNA_ORIENTATION=+
MSMQKAAVVLTSAVAFGFLGFYVQDRMEKSYEKKLKSEIEAEIKRELIQNRTTNENGVVGRNNGSKARDDSDK